MDSTAVTITPEQLRAQREICQKIKEYFQVRGAMPVAFVNTYGCQQNEADSERIRGILDACGYHMGESAEGADLIVLNTCAIREHAETRVYGNVGALIHGKRRHPGQKIFLCGCMMSEPHAVERIRNSYQHVDGVFNPHALWRFPELLFSVLTKGGRVFATELSDGNLAEGLPIIRESSFKAWVSIMYGCNNFCSYCIVPYVRGRERSRQPSDIFAEVQSLLAAGCRDITLLGQNVNSYGRDLSCFMDFSDLLARIAELPGDFLLRFMTSHPKDAGQKLFETMASHTNIAKQLHLPFQSGSDRVLQAMNRRYDSAQYRSLVAMARAAMPEIVLTSDVIVGFPGETEAEFEETLQLVEDVRYHALFTFLYSPRKGTPAAALSDPIPKAEKSKWFDRLLTVQNQISEEIHRAYIGRAVRVLVDGRDGELLTARTEGGRLVRFAGAAEWIGHYLTVQIDDCTTWSLIGHLIEEVGGSTWQS